MLSINWKKPGNRPLLSYLTNNLGLKLLSLLLAIIAWAFVIATTNPIRQKTLTNVQLGINGLALLQASGYTVRDDLSGLPDLRITASLPRTGFAALNNAAVDAYIDISRLSQTGTYTLAVKAAINQPDVTVTGVYPETITITVDKLTHATVPVKLEVSGNLPSNLARGDVTLGSENISISGPESYVTRIAQAVVTVDLAQMTEGYVALLPFHFVDAQGNTVNAQNMDTVPSAVQVDMGIVGRKTVAFEYTSALKNTNALREGYAIKAVTPSAQQLVITGPAELLKNISSLTMEDLDLTGAYQNVADLPVTLVLPEGITLVNPSSLTLSITFEEKIITRTFTVPITYTGLGPIYRLENAPETASVQLTGRYFSLSGITAEDITLTVPLESYAAGTHEITLPSPVLKEPVAGATFATTPASVTVTIVLK